jgi:AAA+ ATPase superfamily predicted ATPase
VRYVITDPLLRFWFKFIHPHSSSILQLGSKAAYRAIIKPHIASYFGNCFESLCRESLPFIYGKENVTADYEVGQYWDKNCQIDIVGYRNDCWTDLGECKWGRITSLKSLLMELEKKIQFFPNKRNATIGKRIFIRGPLPKVNHDGFFLYCLEDLYKTVP